MYGCFPLEDALPWHGGSKLLIPPVILTTLLCTVMLVNVGINTDLGILVSSSSIMRL